MHDVALRRAIVVLLLALAAAADAGAQQLVEITRLDPKYGFILDPDGRSYDEVRVHYRLRGPVPQGQQIWIELRDETTNALFWRTEVPARRSGVVSCPKGTLFRPVRSQLRFALTDVKGSAGPPQSVPSISIDKVVPSTVRLSHPPARLELIGNSFTPLSAAIVARYDKRGERFDILGYAPVEFVNSQHASIAASPSWFSKPGELRIFMQDEMPPVRPARSDHVPASGRSGAVWVAVADAPSLHHINPESVQKGSDHLWITLHGERFVPDCLVFVDAADGQPLTSPYTSASERRVLVPAGLFLSGYDLWFRMQCLDKDHGSEERPLRVVGGREDRGPAIESSVPIRVPPLSSRGSASIEMTFYGTGFKPETVVVAHVDRLTPVELETRWISERELRAVLKRELWGEVNIAFSGGVSPLKR